VTNPKVFEYAKEVGMTPLALMDKIREWQLPVKSHMSELEPEVLEQLKVKLSGGAPSAEAKPKKAVARKAPAKKAEAPVAPTTIARKTATKKADAAPAVAPATTATAKSAVIRRKTKDAADEQSAKADSDVQDEELSAVEVSAPTAPIEKEKVVQHVEETIAPVEAKAKVKEAVTQATSAAPAAAASSAPAAPVATPSNRKKEVIVGTSGVSSSSTPVATVGRRNIIGRMDLSRVSQPHQGRGPGGSSGGPGGAGNARPSFGGAPRPGGPVGGANRNIRAGFMAAPQEIEVGPFVSDDKDKKGIDKRSKKLEGTATPSISAKEREQEELQQFNAVEFRKREMVFQPKKKKGFLERTAMKTQITQPKASKRVVKVNGSMKLSDLAAEMGLKAAQLTKVLMTNGVMATMNTVLDFDTIALIVPEFGWEAQNVKVTAEELVVETAFGDLTAETVIRPPVVTIMGHVDHGKTSLLDTIRKADVASGEAGGITQHIGAYNVKLEDGSQITFLDTPGHEAFTAMRARGANVTDIAIIVVAADDGLMPQTAEAINHAKAAGVPIIVAVNKMDKPGANPERIKQQLTEFELVPEEWGGTTIFCPVSALKKTGIKELLEQIKLVAEMQELKANPKRSGTGVVIEAKLEKGKGAVATLLIKDGTVRVGQSIVAGTMKGRVRSLMNERGERMNEVGPGYPVEVLGLEATPNAGDKFDVVADEATAEKVAGLRRELEEAKKASAGKMSLEDIFSKVKQGDVKELALILKTDVQGSMEALQGMINKLSTSEVKARVIHAAVGGVNESDVLLAQTTKAIIIGFNVRPDTAAQAKSKQLGIEIRSYSIVYELVDDLKKAMTGLLTPDIVEKVMGRVEVRNTFTVPKIGLIAGCFVVDGKIQRTNMVRLLRDNKVVYEGKIGSLKRFKDDAKEVAQGYECGVGIENYNDVKVGDVIEAFIKEEVSRELKQDAQA